MNVSRGVHLIHIGRVGFQVQLDRHLRVSAFAFSSHLFCFSNLPSFLDIVLCCSERLERQRRKTQGIPSFTDPVRLSGDQVCPEARNTFTCEDKENPRYQCGRDKLPTLALFFVPILFPGSWNLWPLTLHSDKRFPVLQNLWNFFLTRLPTTPSSKLSYCLQEKDALFVLTQWKSASNHFRQIVSKTK